ncbi:hypothetical protein HBI38_157530 [Parastagonospora nodorum]|nr:hypothetical protein HBH52_166340 [Parastagonospora nodorum]KAH3996825.1 hypothetical protein HBI10_152590 [Parastagonospora nodorum]KAH4012510.1 hypothetical protein HBI13_187280 [Parastagonospora nodorum]KAH4850467.1 hypothetical protein HBH75_131330 [Parastagonospora nodorum]KAH5097311.1 hypothetical protein HBH72_128210 [Parastagonospora nodorum]
MSLPQEEQDFFHALGCYLENQIDQSPTMPASVSKPLPPAPRASDVALTAAATAFIGNHTAPDADVPKEDECPICLETYADAPEPCLRVMGKAGCTCRIGLVCLGEMLSMSPEKEKKCPLCRALWIASTAPPPRTARPEMVNPGTVGRSSRVADMPRTSASHVSRLSATANPFLPRGITPTPVVNMSRDDAGDEDYSELTRDIENVRARARGTQSSRSQRRQEMRDLIAQRPAFLLSPSVRRTASLAAPAPPRRAQDAGAGATSTPSGDRISSLASTHRRAQDAVAGASSTPSSGRNASIAPPPPRRALDAGAGASSTPPAAERPTIAARRGSARPASIRPPIQLGPGALLLPPANLTPVPKSAAPAHPKTPAAPVRPSRAEEQKKEYQARSRELDTREKELNNRENALEFRDYRLDTREDAAKSQEKANKKRKASLDALESSLNKRTKVLDEREVKVAEKLKMSKEHREEMKRVSESQKDEMTVRMEVQMERQITEMKHIMERQKGEMKNMIRVQQRHMDEL